MKVTVESISPIQKKLLIEIPHEDYLKAREKEFQRVSQRVALKGFRKGKAPRSLLESHYGGEVEKEVLGHLIDHSCSEAIREQKLNPVAPARISDFKHEAGQPIVYTAEVDLRPEIEVVDYKSIPLKKISEKASEEEIGAELKTLQNQHVDLVPLEEGSVAAKGQIALVDYKGLLEGKSFEGGSGQKIKVELGAGNFLPDFEAGVLGMKIGETKNVDVKFPEGYPNKGLAGKTANFEITLTELKQKNLPELDDDFAKDLGEYETLEALKNNIASHIEQHKSQNARVGLFNQSIDFLLEKNVFEVPQLLVDRELEAMFENFKNQLAQRGVNFEQSGVTEEVFREENLNVATRRVKAFFVIEAVAKAEKIEVSADDLKNRVAQIAQSIKQPTELVERYYRENNMLYLIHSQVIEDKVLDFLISNNKIEDAPAA